MLLSFARAKELVRLPCSSETSDKVMSWGGGSGLEEGALAQVEGSGLEGGLHANYSRARRSFALQFCLFAET